MYLTYLMILATMTMSKQRPRGSAALLLQFLLGALSSSKATFRSARYRLI